MPQPILLDDVPARFRCKLQSTLSHSPFGIAISTDNRCSAFVFRHINKCAGQKQPQHLIITGQPDTTLGFS